MLRRDATGIMVQFLTRLVRDDVRPGFVGNRAPIYLRRPQNVPGYSFPRESSGVRLFRESGVATESGVVTF
jgi:hypothetical protein